MTKSEKTLVLLDSHAILHRAFHALPSFTSPKGEPTGALYGFVSMLLKIIKELKPDYLVACYDLPEPTFRHQFYEKYKAKRPKMDSELVPQITASKKILQEFGIPVYEKAGFEADDILATIVEQLSPGKSNLKSQISNLSIVIVTGDLDTLQLVAPKVRVYAMKKGVQEAIMYDEKAVQERYGFVPKLLPDFKGLMGDPSDNIIGVPGIGEKTARTLIQNFGAVEDIYKKLNKDEAFEKAEIKDRIIKILREHEEEAFFSKALAETRSDVPIDFSLSGARWDQGFDKNKIEVLFREFGFRSLLNRLPFNVVEVEPPNGGSTSKILEKKLKVAFWLLDSRRINPDLSDIFSFTKKNSPQESLFVLERFLKEDGLDELYREVEVPLVETLAGMEGEGILLDTDYLKKLSVDYHKRLVLLEKKIWKMAGGEFNISSPKQLSEVLFEKMGIATKGVKRTGQGLLSTRFSELEKIADRHPIVQELFSYRELAKLTSTYIDNLPGLLGKDGRLHTSFNQTGTTTGRLSSSEPNLQNIPIRTDFGRAVRRAFVAERGWSLVSFDYSQVELRVAAALSGDKKMKDAFEQRRDIHNEVASEVFNTPFDKVDAEMRRRAKVINFGIIYGMGVNTLRKNLQCSKEEATAFYDEYFHDFHGMAEFIENVKEKARRDGFTSTFFGRRRYLPEINSPLEFIRKEAERMAVNAPIQGTAADLIKIAMVGIRKILSAEEFLGKAKMILQVHDELLFEIKDDIIKEVTPVIKTEMEKEKISAVPIVVDVKLGRNWADLDKF